MDQAFADQRKEILTAMVAAVVASDNDRYPELYDQLRRLEIESGEFDGPEGTDINKRIGPLTSMTVTVGLNDLFNTVSWPAFTDPHVAVGDLWEHVPRMAQDALEDIVAHVEEDPSSLQSTVAADISNFQPTTAAPGANRPVYAFAQLIDATVAEEPWPRIKSAYQALTMIGRDLDLLRRDMGPLKQQQPRAVERKAVIDDCARLAAAAFLIAQMAGM